MSEVGQQVGRYTLRHRLGTGGMAEVWLAESAGPAGFQKRVVVKAILPHLASDPEFVRLFLSEAKLTAKLNHPNVVQVHELLEENGRYFSVMELVDGGSLRQLIRAARAKGEQLDPLVVARVMLDACLGLVYVHAQTDESGKALGIVHRDISPDNILITRSGNAKVADFGIARASNSTSYTRPGSVRGKLTYIPPEVYRGEKVDPRCDIYALGVVGYEAITFHQPFRAPSEAETINLVLQGNVTPVATLRPETPPELAAIISTAMSPRPEQRFADAEAFARALEAVAPRSAASAVSELVSALLPPLPSIAPAPDETALPSAPIVTASVVSVTQPRRALPKLAIRGLVAAVVVLAGALALGSRAHDEKPAPVVEVAKPTPPPAPVAEPVKPEPAPVVPEPVVEQPPPPVAPVAQTPKTTRARAGSLVVHAYPWADVILDAKPLGITPVGPLAIEPGTHTVTLVNSKLGVTRKVQVQVRAGRTASVEVDLSKAP
ncbi:MAG: serine/threonine-protein kinase [Myxococcaceae bacterium]